MSNLLNLPFGPELLQASARDFVIKRIREWFERNTVLAFEDWLDSGQTAFDLSIVLGELNVAHDTEILNLWELYNWLSPGEELPATAAVDEIYVNSVTGNDETGTGTAANPFQSLSRVQRSLPNYINHQIVVYLSGTFTEMDDINVRFGQEGQLVFQCIDAPAVHSGPWTVNTFTAIGSIEMANDINVLAAGWTPGNERGRFVHVLTGAQAGNFFVISENTANDLIVPAAAINLAPGDTFNIVDPAAIIDPGSDHVRITVSQPENVIRSRLCFINLQMGGSERWEFESLSYAYIWFALTTITDMNLSGVNLSINLDVPAFTADIDPFLSTNDCPKFYVGGPFVCDSNRASVAKTALGLISLNSYLKIDQSTFHYLNAEQGSDLEINFSYADYAAANIISAVQGCSILIMGLYVESATSCVYLVQACCYSDYLEGNGAAISGYTFIVGAGGNVAYNIVPVSAVTADILWTTTGGTSALPAVLGTNVNDTNGAYVVRTP